MVANIIEHHQSALVVGGLLFLERHKLVHYGHGDGPQCWVLRSNRRGGNPRWGRGRRGRGSELARSRSLESPNPSFFSPSYCSASSPDPFTIRLLLFLPSRAIAFSLCDQGGVLEERRSGCGYLHKLMAVTKEAVDEVTCYPKTGSPPLSVQQTAIRRLLERVDAANRSSPVRTSGA